jgi:hypothetical protein
VKSFSVSKRSRTLQALLDQAREEDVVVRADDGTQFLIRAIDDFGREIESQRRNKKLMAFLDKCAQETAWVPLTEIEKSLRLPPRKSNKRTRA